MTLNNAGRLPALLLLMLLTAACATPENRSGLDPELVGRAVQTATELRAAGGRVWCVPFARDVSGIEIRGNAGTWWGKANEVYERGNSPELGAVMVFTATRQLPLGHIAVVSKVESAREIRVDHANWHRNQVSLGMAVIDVSPENDWSSVRVESRPGSFGRAYPVSGFILPEGARG